MLTKFLTVAAAVTIVSAQTFTDCDPTKRDGCPTPKALGSKGLDWDYANGPDGFLKDLAGTKITYDKALGAAEYIINEPANAPTTESDKYIFFGQVDVTLKPAKGKGIVTSIVLESDDLDEIDWEWVGSNNGQVQTNYFSKGCNATYDRGGFTPVTNALDEYHTYTLKWTRDRLDWIINGNVVRTLNAAGLSGCAGYPQSPMRVKLGTWVAGKAGNEPGTIEWAGGLANFDEAPFIAYYKSIKVVDYMGGGGAKEATEYQYTDRSGSWQSIKVVNDGKAVDNDDKSTSTGDKTSTKTGPTTLSTSSSAPSSGGNGTGSANTTGGSGQQTTPTGTRTAPPTGAPTSAAGKAALTLGNVAAIGAALFYFAL